MSRLKIQEPPHNWSNQKEKVANSSTPRQTWKHSRLITEKELGRVGAF